jgi:signal transduction histidine kinase
MEGPERLRRLPLTMAAVAGASLAVTATVALASPLQFAYRQPALHVALETTAAGVAIVGAYLVVGRFKRRRRFDDLILAQALVLFALTNLLLGALPAALSPGPKDPAVTWAALACRLVAAATWAHAAFASGRSVAIVRLRRTAALAPIAVLALITTTAALLEQYLPAGVEVSLPAEASYRPQVVGHPVVIGAQIVVMVLFALGAIGFLRRFRREGDELIGWLAVASVPAAVARLNYALFPSLYSEWVYTGDLFRLLFYVLILAAAAREVQSYWRAQSEAAVLEERQRLARDLHDGLAQELAFVRRNIRRLDRDNAIVQRADAGATRALQESRRAIAALTEPLDQPLDEALRRTAQEVAAREGTHVALHLVPGMEVSPVVREALVRITAEAITNAARHGGADLVRVELEDGEHVRLRIVDSGRGFDPATGRPGGFGLTSMRQRGERLGGRVSVRSTPGQGTEVEVAL